VNFLTKCFKKDGKYREKIIPLQMIIVNVLFNKNNYIYYLTVI
jgi:hypothetical protein